MRLWRVSGRVPVYVSLLCLGVVLRIVDCKAEIASVELVSRGTELQQAALGQNYADDMTPDGRFVVLTSNAPNLVANDTNELYDVFILDRNSGVFERVSVSSDGTQGNGASLSGRVSDDGRYVVFASLATNLVAGDQNGVSDVFLRDRSTHETTRLSVATDGVTELTSGFSNYSISGNGAFVVFNSSATNLLSGHNNHAQVYLRDISAGPSAITRVSNIDQTSTAGNNDSTYPEIGNDGCNVVFRSLATDLIAAGTTVGRTHLYVRNVCTNATALVDRADGLAGAEGGGNSSSAAISADGRYVAFASAATNLVSGDTNGVVDIFVRDLQDNLTTRVSRSTAGGQAATESLLPSISSDGEYVSFQSTAATLVSGDTNSAADVFLHNRNNGETVRVGVSATGDQSSSGCTSSLHSLGQNGRYALFSSTNTSFAGGDSRSFNDLYLRDVQDSTTTWLTQVTPSYETDGESYYASISADGNFVAFSSVARNLYRNTAGFEQIYIRDRVKAETIFVTSDFTAHSTTPAISADGRFVVFQSASRNFVPGDSNSVADIFVYNRITEEFSRASVASDGTQSNAYSEEPTISATGRYVGFQTSATNLAPVSGHQQSYVHDNDTGSTRIVSVAADGVTIGNDASYSPRISADGQYAVFSSDASNLIDDDTNGVTDLFVKDLISGAIERVSFALNGAQMTSGVSGFFDISPDARYIAFDTYSPDMGLTDTNGSLDLFLYDRQTHQTICISCVDETHVSDGGGQIPFFSADGHYLLFTSYATDLVAGDTNGKADIFSYSMANHTLERLSVAPDGVQGNGDSGHPSASNDRAFIAFESKAGNLASGDTNGLQDILVATYDFCPSDSLKTVPGICGCGVADTDTDADGTADCVDQCPNDAARSADVDSDGDGTLNCNDLCANDGAKLIPGVCGCGILDVDSDGDGTLDCNDACPDDGSKTIAGICGCGKAEVDSDADGVLDCNDICPADAAKTTAGVCGCGKADSDLNKNGVPDCVDPTSNLVPTKPVVKVKKNSATVTMQAFSKVVYEMTLVRSKAKATKKTSLKNTYSLKSLKKGTYKLSYKIRVGKTTTKSSKAATFKIK